MCLVKSLKANRSQISKIQEEMSVLSRLVVSDSLRFHGL